MGVTTSQSKRDRQLVTFNMSDNESENSFSDLLSRYRMVEFDNGDLLNQGQSCNRNQLEHKFNDMNRQIGDLPSIVLALPEAISSNIREKNGMNSITTESNSRSQID